MPFFSFLPGVEEGGEERFIVSGKFWVFWVVALPITGLTMLLWYYWHRSRFGPGIDTRTSAASTLVVPEQIV